jgi:hypothetical protein
MNGDSVNAKEKSRLQKQWQTKSVHRGPLTSCSAPHPALHALYMLCPSASPVPIKSGPLFTCRRSTQLTQTKARHHQSKATRYYDWGKTVRWLKRRHEGLMRWAVAHAEQAESQYRPTKHPLLAHLALVSQAFLRALTRTRT